MRPVGGDAHYQDWVTSGAVNALASGAGTPWFALARPGGFPQAFAPFVIIHVTDDTLGDNALSALPALTLGSLLLMEVGTAPAVDRLTGGRSIWGPDIRKPATL